MNSGPSPSSFYLEKDQFLYIDLIALQMADSKAEHDGSLASSSSSSSASPPPSPLRRCLRRFRTAVTPSWPRCFPKLPETLAMNWHLGLTAFGGAPVQFQMLHKKFVEDEAWIDEQVFQEIFALSQALPGSASTKMLACINYIHSGLLAGMWAFLLWSLPGALGMYGLSLGVAQIGDTLPLPVYALLSGLNSATVGIIALAAMQLAQMAVTDRLTRALVYGCGAGGMLYTALWYFPVLMIAAGATTLIFDFRLLPRLFAYILRKQRPRKLKNCRDAVSEVQAEANRSLTNDDLQRFIYTRALYIGDIEATARDPTEIAATAAAAEAATTAPGSSSSSTIFDDPPPPAELEILTWKVGTAILAAFALSLIIIMILRSLVPAAPRALGLLQNLYLAGTIIFGGGPVAIPLLKEYIVSEGWVSQRDFLIGLALIQALPGPNFNFAVYLGALAVAGTALPSAVGALIAYVAIFLPGLVIVTGTMGLWRVLRSKSWLRSLLRGVNAGAVGLVFTAVYKLWQIGAVSPLASGGQPLGSDPWWVAITASAFVGGCWFKVKAPVAILIGGCMGLAWYGAVRPW